MYKFIPVLVLFVVLVAIACGSSSTSTPVKGTPPTEPAAAPTQVPPATATLSPRQVPAATSVRGTGNQASNNGCVPNVPLGVSVGESWTITGSIEVTGPFPGNLPSGVNEHSSTFSVTEIGDWVRIIQGEEVKAKNSRVVFQATDEIRSMDGQLLTTESEERTGLAPLVINMSPLLTLDWECHKNNWLASLAESEPTVGERVLSSGVTIVVFSDKQSVDLPAPGSAMEGERHLGYDKLTGRLVFVEFSAIGTVEGEHFTSISTQELVPEPDDSVGVIKGEATLPDWLTSLIHRLKKEPVANPPAQITQYEYKGDTVYFLPQRCCDIFSELYDADGNIIGNPDGGITGRGDGRVPDFFDTRNDESVVWKDERGFDPNLVQVPAPIDSREILVMESFPVQYSVAVVSGLPNGCASFAGYRMEWDEERIQIEIINWKPADSDVFCTENYRTVESNIPLGIEFESGTKYTVEVNEKKEVFVAQ